MEWVKLLSKERLCSIGEEDKSSGRSPFQRDFDRIAFSSAFRRLQDKTQVHPLAESDYIRTRLTHSIEASCVARSLGSIVGEHIIGNYELNGYSAADFGAIVAAASLAHDIGNPPLGHSGEFAVQHWFKTSELSKKLLSDLNAAKKNDFENFDGNAQGFRVLTRLQRPDNDGGMQLTCATLAAFMKYPRISYITELSEKDTKENIALKKYGFFKAEYELFSEVAKVVGLNHIIAGKAWCRHPLAFLVEAADDICYKIVDFEDGVRLGHISYETIETLFFNIISTSKHTSVKNRLDNIKSNENKIECLRSEVINELIDQVTQCFIDNEKNILSGYYKEELIKQISASKAVDYVYNLSKQEIYTSRSVVEIEAAGYEVLGGLLEVFIDAVNDVASKKITGEKPSKKSEKILQLIPVQFLKAKDEVDDDLYTRIIQITDFVSGMTDSFAVSTYKMIKGISLPHE